MDQHIELEERRQSVVTYSDGNRALPKDDSLSIVSSSLRQKSQTWPQSNHSVVSFKDDNLEAGRSENTTSNARLLERPGGGSESVTIVEGKGIHWKAPVSMIGFWLAGVFVALGHHAYYHSLINRIVAPDVPGSWNLDDQQWHVRIGTGFAFLAKTLFVASTVVASRQYAWVEFRKRSHAVQTLDAIVSSPGDITSFFCLDFTLRAGVLPFLAAIAWLLPLGATITPATLTVKPSQNSQTFAGNVPYINLTDPSSLNFQDDPYVFTTSTVLTRKASSVMTEAQIYAMEVVYPNSSYTMDFQGPSLQCRPASSDESALLDSYFETFKTTDLEQNSNFTQVPVYIALSPVDRHQNASQDAAECITAGNVLTTYECSVQQLLEYQVFATSRYNNTAVLFRLYDERWSCSLQITNFSVTFDASSTQQVVGTNYTYESSSFFDYFYAESSQGNGSVPFDLDGSDPSDPSSASYILNSYISVMQAVINIFRGAITVVADLTSMGGGLQTAATVSISNTRIMESMANSLVMSALANATSVFTGTPLIQSNSSSMPSEINRSLGQIIEEVSRNMTLSLLSMRDFWTDAGRGKTVNVTQTSPVQRYQYAARNLFIAYGTSALLSAICVALGLWALHSNGVSHSMNFSSFVATTRNHTLDEIFQSEGLGAEPMAQQVLAQRLRFGVVKGNNMAAHVAFGIPEEVVSVVDKKTL